MGRIYMQTMLQLMPVIENISATIATVINLHLILQIYEINAMMSAMVYPTFANICLQF